MHTNYGVTAAKMSKTPPCQMVFVLMVVVGGGAWHLWAVELLRVAGTVCGRPLAHMPAPLSTLLTLQTPATPRCASPLPSVALYTRIISQQKKKKREPTQVVRSWGRLSSPSILSILPLLVLLPWLPSPSPSSVTGVVIQRDTLLAEINPF